MAEPSSKMRLAPEIMTSCASTRAAAGPMMGIWRRAASFSISASTASRGGRRLFMYRSISGLTITEDPREDFIHVAELALERKALSDLRRLEHARDFRIALDRGAKVRFVFPGLHGVTLHDAVGCLAQHSGGREIEQKLAREYQTAGHLQIAAHALGIDQKLVDEMRGFVEQIIGQDGRIRQDDTLDRGV